MCDSITPDTETDVIIFMKFSPLAALAIVFFTTSGAASNKDLASSFQLTS